MAYWEWTADLELGIDVIDNQHRRIVDYINELDEAMKANDTEQVGHVLQELVDYTVTHFAFEENLMEKGGYKLIDAHKMVHEKFTDRIHQYRDEFLNGEDVSRKLMSELRVWLTNHIKRDDEDYAPVVKASMEEVQKGWLGKTLKKFFG